LTRIAPSSYDVDTIDDLLRLERDLAWLPSRCARPCAGGSASNQLRRQVPPARRGDAL
jgi:hypothetical protein